MKLSCFDNRHRALNREAYEWRAMILAHANDLQEIKVDVFYRNVVN